MTRVIHGIRVPRKGTLFSPYPQEYVYIFNGINYVCKMAVYEYVSGDGVIHSVGMSVASLKNFHEIKI